MSAKIFIDADNVKPEIGFKAVDRFSLEHTIEQVEIIGNETTLSSKYMEAADDRYDIKNCFYGKNSADTWLCTEIAKTIFEKPEIDVIIIISSDRDFLAAIKLVTDQKRKVIMVSDGNGHKNLKALLYDLRVNPDLVELVDFKTELNPPAPEKKIVPFKQPTTNNKTLKITQPKSDVDKIKAICRNFPPNMKNFILKNKPHLQLIKVNHAGKFWEVPFYEGMNFSTFTNILVALKIIPNGKYFDKIVDENFFKCVNNQIFLNYEEPPAPEENPFDDVINYFVNHAAESKNIFIKCDGKLFEIPFVNGISLEIFSRLLEGYAISDDSNKIKDIIAESFLELREDKIYFCDEEIISDELDSCLADIPLPALEFLVQNENRLKIVSIAHNNAVHNFPFVDGMHLSILVSMLRHLKIIGKNSDSRKILLVNGFTIKSDLVYKNNAANCPPNEN